jgi:YggT family protein
VGIVSSILVAVLSIYLVLLIGRMIFETVQAFARSWHPQGVVLVLAEAIYTATDPPLKFLRRFIPPLRLGTVAFDPDRVRASFLIGYRPPDILRARQGDPNAADAR